jgi:hypothetical protein
MMQKENSSSRIVYQIPEYKQRYLCFSACVVNAMKHYDKHITSLKNLEFEITQKSLSFPYLYIIFSKLAYILAKDYKFDVILYQSRETIPTFEEIEEEYKKNDLKIFRVTHLSKEDIFWEAESVTKDRYEFIKEQYEYYLRKALEAGVKFIVASPTLELLKQNLREGRLSVWTKMINNSLHSTLLYGFDENNKCMYFFDPILGGELVRFRDIQNYLKVPVMSYGISIYKHQ